MDLELENGVLQPVCVRGLNFPGKVEESIVKEEDEWNWEAIGGWLS